MGWDDVSFVLGSEYKKRILLALDTPRTPSQIAKRTKISLSNVGTQLGHLREWELVECLTPKARKGRIYALTKKGESAMKRVEKMEG